MRPHLDLTSPIGTPSSACTTPCSSGSPRRWCSSIAPLPWPWPIRRRPASRCWTTRPWPARWPSTTSIRPPGRTCSAGRDGSRRLPSPTDGPASRPTMRRNAGSSIGACRLWTPRSCRTVSRSLDRGRRSGGADEIDDHPSQLGTLVLLEEVAASGDGHMVLAAATRDAGLQLPLGTGRDGIAVAEGGEERLVERLEHRPGPAVGWCCGVVGGDRHQRRELPRALGEGLVGKRGVICRDDLRAQLGDTAGVDDDAGGEVLHLLGEFEPSEEGLTGLGVTGGQEGVGGHDPVEALRVLADQPKADQAAPV